MSKNTESVTNVQSIIERFISELNVELESNVTSVLRDKMAAALGGQALPIARKASVKRNYHRKPCPVPGCHNLAAPRHSMVCVEHKDLSQHDKDDCKAEAMRPGGVWYHEKEKKSKAKAKNAHHSVAA